VLCKKDVNILFFFFFGKAERNLTLGSLAAFSDIGNRAEGVFVRAFGGEMLSLADSAKNFLLL
jgi:hypothetical protein